MTLGFFDFDEEDRQYLDNKYFEAYGILNDAQKPVVIRVEGEDVESCPRCGNWSIRLCKHCPDCGKRLNHEFQTHEDYSI